MESCTLVIFFPIVGLHFSEEKGHSINIYLVDITKQVDCAIPEWLIFNKIK